jgi:hypothetical protein
MTDHVCLASSKLLLCSLKLIKTDRVQQSVAQARLGLIQVMLQMKELGADETLGDLDGAISLCG